METGNGNGTEENSQQYRDSSAGSVSVNPTITTPLFSPASPSSRLNASPRDVYYLIAEATRFSADITRLSDELAAAKHKIAVQDEESTDAKKRIAVQDEEMAQLQDQVHQQTVQLAEAVEIMTEEQNKIAELEQEKQDAEEKLQKMKESMKAVMGELHEFIVGLVENVEQEDYTSNVDLTPQNRLDRLSEFVENKFEAWAASQRKLKTEATNVNAVCRKLEKVVETKRVGMSSVPPAQQTSIFGKRQQQQQQQQRQVAQRSLRMSVSSVPSSQRTNVIKSTMSTNTHLPASTATAVVNPLRQSLKASTLQFQFKAKIPPPPKTVPGNKFHAEDTARFSEGFFCICGTDYSSHSNLRTHIRKFTENGKFKCKVCKQHFLHFYMLRHHLKDKHDINNNKSVGCSVCGKEFKTFTLLYEHRKYAHPKGSFKKRHASSGQPDNSSTRNKTQQRFYDEEDDDDVIFIGVVTAATAITATTSAQPQPSPPTYSNDTDENDDEIERPINYFGKRHGFDNTKCRQGFFCICGSKFWNRRKLDIHVRRSNQQDLSGKVINYNDEYYEVEEEEEEEVVVHDEIEEVEVEEQQVDEEEEEELDTGYGRVISLNGIHRHPQKHGAHTTNPLEFACELCFMRCINTACLKQHMIRKHQQEISIEEIMRKTGCSKCGMVFPSMQLFRRHDKMVHGSTVLGRKKRTSNLTTRNNGFNRRGRGCDTITQFSRVRTTQVRRRPSISNSTTNNRITAHHSAIIGQNKKGRLANPVENDPPMQKLKNEGRRCVSTSAASSPPPSPQAIPISIDDENGAPANGDNEQPSSSAAAATVDVYEYDQQDNEEENMDESQNDDSQRHAIDSTKIDQGNFCLCGSEFNERKNLLCHIKRHTEKWRFQCNVCKKPFYYNSALKRHMLSTHKVTNIYARNKRVGCVTCGETFVTMFELRQHAKNVHSSRQEANAEPQGRPSLGALQKHIRLLVESGERFSSVSCVPGNLPWKPKSVWAKNSLR